MSEHKIDPDLYPASAITSLIEENERLKRAVETLETVVSRTENQWVQWEATAEAAEARAQAAEQRVKDAVKVLEPFSVMAGYLFAHNWEDSGVVVGFDETHRLTFADFRAARRFIKEAGE